MIGKEKSDQIAKSEKLFWFLTTLIAFALAYIISIMGTGFLMAKKYFDKQHVYLKRDQKNCIGAIIKWMNKLCLNVVVLNLNEFLSKLFFDIRINYNKKQNFE